MLDVYVVAATVYRRVREYVGVYPVDSGGAEARRAQHQAGASADGSPWLRPARKPAPDGKVELKHRVTLPEQAARLCRSSRRTGR